MTYGKVDICIIGAGIAGLLAADRLQKNGLSVIVLDKGRGVGGRMSVRRFANSVCDHGAQFFTVKNERFASLVEQWKAEGLVIQWSSGFQTFNGGVVRKNQTYYRCRTGMNDITKHLAKNLNIRTEEKVQKISFHEGYWKIYAEKDKGYKAKSIIMTPPVPQILNILDKANFKLDSSDRDVLNYITYDPCIALMVVLKGKSNLPEPGGIFGSGEPIQWMADNNLKGISPKAFAVTIHAGPNFSHKHWETDDENIRNLLVGAAEKWLGPDLIDYQIHRWRYSKPVEVYPETCYVMDAPAPLLLAGDGFHGPRVEGAAVSGLAAAEKMIDILNQ